MRRLRIASQTVFAALFLVLFMNTRYLGADVIAWPVNAFFRIDPLAGFTAMAAAREALSFFWPLLLVVPVALLLGRLFCGWICPLGSLLDAVGWLTGGGRKGPAEKGGLRWVKDPLLVLFLAGAVFSLNLSGLLDPLSLLIRSLAIGVVPPSEGALRALLGAGYDAGGFLRAASAPLDRFLGDHLLSFRQPAFVASALFLGLFAAILLLERLRNRFWCRNLCPLGALLSWLGARAPLGLGISGRCTGCGKCGKVCPTGAIVPQGSQGSSAPVLLRKECVLCEDCVAVCPEAAISHGVRSASPVPAADLSRRGFLGWAAGGAALPATLLLLPPSIRLPPRFIRPPGSLPEGEFLARCVRCGECMRVCLTNGIQPALFEAGPAAFWTPRLHMRMGYCEYNCTLCGQVCPTGAIRDLHPAAKKPVRIGTAVIHRDLCIPFIRPEQCMVCEEHCPIPEKAIVFDEVEVPAPDGGPSVTVKRPRVVRERCNGCGICENKCPLEARSAIEVFREGEDRLFQL